jgi:NADP-dependent 3-hydroxy acid dehydrogenase YdfG
MALDMSGKRLEGKVAIVTGMFSTSSNFLSGTNEELGGASGFGAAISTRFAQEGCKVLIADLNEFGAKSMSEKIGGTEFMHMDVTQESDWKKAVDMCIEKFGRLDILVNNAGTSYKNKVSLNY